MILEVTHLFGFSLLRLAVFVFEAFLYWILPFRLTMLHYTLRLGYFWLILRWDGRFQNGQPGTLVCARYRGIKQIIRQFELSDRTESSACQIKDNTFPVFPKSSDILSMNSMRLEQQQAKFSLAIIIVLKYKSITFLA